MNREAELEFLSHPEKWPHRGLLPLARRGGNIIYGKKDAGIVMENDLCCVWTGYYLGEVDPRNGRVCGESVLIPRSVLFILVAWDFFSYQSSNERRFLQKVANRSLYRLVQRGRQVSCRRCRHT